MTHMGVHSRLQPSLTEMVSGSRKDFDGSNDPVGLDLHRTTYENGRVLLPVLQGVGGRQVRLPSREPDPIAPVDWFGGGKSVRRIGQCCIGNREMGHAGLEWCV